MVWLLDNEISSSLSRKVREVFLSFSPRHGGGSCPCWFFQVKRAILSEKRGDNIPADHGKRADSPYITTLFGHKLMNTANFKLSRSDALLFFLGLMLTRPRSSSYRLLDLLGVMDDKIIPRLSKNNDCWTIRWFKIRIHSCSLRWKCCGSCLWTRSFLDCGRSLEKLTK